MRNSLPIPPTPKNLKYASGLRAAALLDLAKGTFSASKYFPNSKSRISVKQLPSVREALVTYLRDSEKSLSKTSVRDYTSIVNGHLIPQFGKMRLDEVSAQDIRSWISDLELSGKRINNLLIPLRHVFAQAFYSEQLERNPLDRIKNVRHQSRPPDPFSLSEITKILDSCSGEIRALFQFAFWTGLRTSELIALEWGDVDPGRKFVHVNKAVVRGNLKETKTYSGTRSVQLFSLSNEALDIASKSRSDQSNRVFINPRTLEPWSTDGQIRKTAWIPTLKRAGVHYRTAYQTRHTYASQMLSLGVEPMWLAQQMGHRDWGMIRRVYGRWMDDSRPDIFDNVEAKLAQIGHAVE